MLSIQLLSIAVKLVLCQFWWKVFANVILENKFPSKTYQFRNKKETREFKHLRFCGSNNLSPKLTKNQICVHFSFMNWKSSTCSEPKNYYALWMGVKSHTSLVKTKYFTEFSFIIIHKFAFSLIDTPNKGWLTQGRVEKYRNIIRWFSDYGENAFSPFLKI